MTIQFFDRNGNEQPVPAGMRRRIERMAQGVLWVWGTPAGRYVVKRGE